MGGTAAAIEQGIVGQANFLGGLGTAILGAMVVLRMQYRLNDRAVCCTWAFWVATIFVVPTVGLVFAISGLMIELAPILFSFSFAGNLEFSEQAFDNCRMDVLHGYSRAQMYSFIGASTFGGLFIFSNIVEKRQKPREGDSYNEAP